MRQVRSEGEESTAAHAKPQRRKARTRGGISVFAAWTRRHGPRQEDPRLPGRGRAGVASGLRNVHAGLRPAQGGHGCQARDAERHQEQVTQAFAVTEGRKSALRAPAHRRSRCPHPCPVRRASIARRCWCQSRRTRTASVRQPPPPPRRRKASRRRCCPPHRRPRQVALPPRRDRPARPRPPAIAGAKADHDADRRADGHFGARRGAL